MIQDIFPSRLNNSYRHCTPDAQDWLLYFDESGRLLTKAENGALCFLRAAEHTRAVYLFSVDEERYFLAEDAPEQLPEGYAYYTVRELRDICTGGKMLFAAFTAYHLWKWYSDNKFCAAVRSPEIPWSGLCAVIAAAARSTQGSIPP